MSHPASHEAVPLPSIEELQALYETYRQAYFDGRLPPVSDVTLEWSNRLTASAGLCKPQERIIRLSTHYHRKYPGEVGMTLLHEMIHLLVPGHGPAFRRWMEEIRRRGGRVARYARERATPRTIRWVYTCPCGQVYPRSRRLPHGGQAYRCGRCRGRLTERRLQPDAGRPPGGGLPAVGFVGVRWSAGQEGPARPDRPAEPPGATLKSGGLRR